jgi:hypothetical protein
MKRLLIVVLVCSVLVSGCSTKIEKGIKCFKCRKELPFAEIQCRYCRAIIALDPDLAANRFRREIPPVLNIPQMVAILIGSVAVGGAIFTYWTLRQKDLRKVSAKFSKEYEQRKLTIGTIKCSQCEWSGPWGTNMTRDQFVAGNQYICPNCNSPNWQKV